MVGLADGPYHPFGKEIFEARQRLQGSERASVKLVFGRKEGWGPHQGNNFPFKIKMIEAEHWRDKNPSILFVNPSIGTKKYEREDGLRTYLSLGTMASALTDRSFLRRLAIRSGRKELIFENESDYPSFDVKVINLSLKPETLPIEAYLDQFIKKNGMSALMICATATSAQLDEAREVAEAAKSISPDALRVIGGPHVSVLPSQYLNDSEYQVACIGEGVETLTETAMRLNRLGDGDISTVPGTAYRIEGGEVRLNPPRKCVLALDDYPFPSNSVDLFLDDSDDVEKNRRDLVYIFVGSGCPYHCVFCAQRAIHKGAIKERSADSIFAEIKKLHGRGFYRFALVQETILNHSSRIDRLCHLIENSGIKFEWTAETRAEQVSFTLLNRMRDAGLRFLQIGVETGDQELLDCLGKRTSLGHVKKLRAWCEELKISTTFYMLVGLPGQDWQSILKSALFLRDHPPYNRITMHISASIAVPYPGTKIAQDRTVRLLVEDDKTLNWPDRNPVVTVNEKGEFVGQSYTETDDMTSGEILESLIYLDDFGHFLLHEMYDLSYSDTERAKARGLARRMFYMILRRTIRDLIVRAQIDLTPEKRKNAYLEILERDAGREGRFGDVTEFMEENSETFTRFLSKTRFTNGFHTMKCLNISNRIKWMKVCAAVWGLEGKNFRRLRFELDHERAGEKLDRFLSKLDDHKVDGFLQRLDSGSATEIFFEDVIRRNDGIKVFGVEFVFDDGGRELNIRDISASV